MSKRTKKFVEEFKTKLIDKGIDVSEFEDYFKEIENNLKDKKYGLVWENHTEEIETELLTKFPILKEEKELRIHNNTEEGLTNNFLIEGDNLESLTALKNMGKKVDVIYIDPPYNTGNRDFIYEDRYVDSEDGFRHSKWVSFMEKRLKIAKDLLTDEGVIFISIDDNEMAQLKMVCDDIFGEQNFINNFMWMHGKGKKTRQSRTLQQYNLCYVKDIKTQEDWVEIKELDYKFNNPDNDPKGDWFSGSISFSEKRSNSSSRKFYGVKSPSGKKWERQWMVTEEEMIKMIEEGDIYFGESPEFNKVPRRKVRRGKAKVIPKNIIESVGTTKSADNELRGMLGGVVFDYPKPVGLINHIIKMVVYDKTKATILDFFAGSGTTGQAVLELNKEDGGNRNFILCTNNENNICRDVTYQRLNKVINGYTTPKGKEVEGIPSNLTYLKTELIEKEDDLIDFEVREEIYESMINNLKVLHNISNTINLKEGRLTKLVGEDKDFYMYDNFYIDSDDFEGIELDSTKTNVIYVKEENLTDVVLNKFDEVIGLEDLVRY